MKILTPLEFEKSIYQIEDKIEELKNLSEETGIDLDNQIKTLVEQAQDYKEQLYSNLSPSQKLQIARHSKRPTFLDYVSMITTDWVEMHGDRAGTDDRAIMGGIAIIENQPVMLIGTQKGKTTKENLEYNFGMPQPEGYRKALRLFNHANRFNLPIITLIDTPGAYPGIKAEQTGQGIAIAVNLCEMAKLETPLITVILGEGCSGGALGLAVANRVYMLEHALYTVISPEGCASILWRSADMACIAAESLKITSDDLLRLGIIDGVIKEPLGGAHYDWEMTANNLKQQILESIKELSKMSGNEIKTDKYDKFRKMGVFVER
ncbi:MAG: acetyl-CoA carboxylase carboxyltransferase subunit alpha [Candidatus Melainabacteria bacterium GWF2_37_15]|nr:MAG: acetyl-CoA carboxylase carboxyltransferase subunit alpha [Candidatus Melainabacteria bacterium GWF2_37_15]